MIAAKRKMLAVLSVGELGLPETSCGSAGSMTSVLDLLPPPPRQHAVMVEDEKTAPERILEFLVERRLL
jgi:electron transfer flavoprotein beta subunit